MQTTLHKNMQLPTSTLYFQNGSSDKVYHCEIINIDNLYNVCFNYGKRGSTMKSGVKNPKPTTLEEAKKIYDKLVSSKLSKGYRPSEDVASSYTVVERKRTQFSPQLLNSIDEEVALELLENDNYIMQEKMDGERMILDNSKDVVASNKQGFSKAISQVIVNSLDTKKFTIDGESIGDTYYAFDCLSFNLEDITQESYLTRYNILKDNYTFNESIKLVPIAVTTEEKKSLFKEIKERNGEGVVFKSKSSKYSPGRPSYGGDQLKFKFYATATCKVLAVNNKRSVEVGILDGEKWIGVGNVTIPVNKDIPEVNNYIEVRYLYAYKGGSLFQTIFLGIRDDVDDADCTIMQLKYKA